MTVHRFQSSSTDAMWLSAPFFSQKSSKVPYAQKFSGLFHGISRWDGENAPRLRTILNPSRHGSEY
jgi:hypothetical protein